MSALGTQKKDALPGRAARGGRAERSAARHAHITARNQRLREAVEAVSAIVGIRSYSLRIPKLVARRWEYAYSQRYPNVFNI